LPVPLLALAWSALGSLALILFFGWRLAHPPEAPLPVYGTLPAVNLVDQDNVAFGTNRLKGNVWIANFIFTSCPSVCPLLSKRMAAIQDELRQRPERVHLVSISVDPETDTPAVLKEYGERYHADLKRWSFLTGNPDAVLAAIGDGFKMAVQRTKGTAPADSPDGFAIVHGENFVLVDGTARIRGYYHRDDADQARLLADALRLARAGGT
jgi:protein SCO1/2